jgi:hypothetical protein
MKGGMLGWHVGWHVGPIKNKHLQGVLILPQDISRSLKLTYSRLLQDNHKTSGKK